MELTAHCRILLYALHFTDSRWVHDPMGLFFFCAAVTHFGSASTHVYPDNVPLVCPTLSSVSLQLLSMP